MYNAAMARCICNPQTEKDMQDLDHYGCPEEICPGCYMGKQHDDPFCVECMHFLEEADKELTDPQAPVTMVEMPKVLYLMQGVPGSGKSIIARMIADFERANGKQVSHLSTDDWRFDDDGIYQFDPADNARYHKACQQAAAEDMMNGVEVVIIDNTNIREWEVHPYLVLADIHGYIVQVVSVDAGLGNSITRQEQRREDRRVPSEVIIRMYNEMERLLAQPGFAPPMEG